MSVSSDAGPPFPVTGPVNVIRYTGSAIIPYDVRNRRVMTHQALRRMGTPVILKHMFNAQDAALGWAVESANMDTVYGQPYYNDVISHGVGFVGGDGQGNPILSDNEWIDPTGSTITTSLSSPGAGYVQAPKYRGYGPGYLCYAILPDVPEDVWKLTPQGALFQTEQARVHLPWYPQVGDNDIMIMVEIDRWENVTATYERFRLKQVQPVSVRGLDRFGIREFSRPPAGGNRLWVAQYCEADKEPESDLSLYAVETDR